MTTRDEYIATIRQSSRAIEPLPTGESAVLKTLHQIEAVLLDVYGTLFMSASGDIGSGDELVQSIALRQVLQDAGLSVRFEGSEGLDCLHETIELWHKQARQAGIDFPEVDIVEVWRKTLRLLQLRGRLDGDLSHVDVAALSLRYELATNPVWPMPGAAECLTELASRGIHLGVISNAQWFTPLIFPALLGGELDALGISPGMQIWSWRVGWAKPSDHLFRLAADVLLKRGVQPERVLYVGNDMLNDIVPASAVGFRTALFAGDRRSLRRRQDDPRVASIAPDVVLINLRDLLSCIRCHSDS